jgi:hypothetical protein
MEIESKWQGE